MRWSWEGGGWKDECGGMGGGESGKDLKLDEEREVESEVSQNHANL